MTQVTKITGASTIFLDQKAIFSQKIQNNKKKKFMILKICLKPLREKNIRRGYFEYFNYYRFLMDGLFEK